MVFKEALGIFDYFADRAAEPRGAYDEKKTRPFDATVVDQYVGSSGVQLTNETEGGKSRVSRVQIAIQVRRRSGQLYSFLAHLGDIYAQPFPQYSALRFDETTDRQVLEMPGWYRVTFGREDGRWKIIQIGYTVHGEWIWGRLPAVAGG